MEKTAIIYHSADYDGLFSREVALKFNPGAKAFGWDFGDKALLEQLPTRGPIIVIDLPVDQPIFGASFDRIIGPLLDLTLKRVVWIDHHKSSIDSHPKDIVGYRIDGVAACRLAWQWFTFGSGTTQKLPFPEKENYVDRRVMEPLAVRMAGEYDVWDHRDNDADVAFQFGLDGQKSLNWDTLLTEGQPSKHYTDMIVGQGRVAMQCYAKRDADIMNTRSFMVEWWGLKFLALTTARCNSNTFAAKDMPETGHDALMAFFYTGREWSFSLYHAAHRKELDLSEIAKKHGGGGHRGACGFRVNKIPFIV